MRLLKRALVVLALAGFFAASAAAQEKLTTPLIPREVLFGNPERADPQISPDGTQLGYLAPVDGVMNVWIRTLGKADDRAVTAAAVRAANRELASYQHIRRWVVWPDPDLPRTSTGKIMRSVVAATLRNMVDGNLRPSTGPPAGGTLANVGVHGKPATLQKTYKPAQHRQSSGEGAPLDVALPDVTVRDVALQPGLYVDPGVARVYVKSEGGVLRIA